MTVSLGAKWWRVRHRARQGPAGKKAKECCGVQAGPALDTEQHRSGSGGPAKAEEQNPWVLHSPLFLSPCVSSGVVSSPSGNNDFHGPGSGPCGGSCRVPTPTPDPFPQPPLLKPEDWGGGQGFSFQVEMWSVPPYFLTLPPEPLPTPPPPPALSTAQMNLSRRWPGLPRLISTASLHSLPTTSPFPLSPQPKLPL